jgi:hypothetical protein
MHIRSLIIIFFTIIPITLKADRFSEIAEAHNVLDRMQLLWSNKPFPTELKLFGFVKSEGIFDTRQNFTLRSGQFLYFPLQKMPDVIGRDINGRGDFDIYAIQSRIDLEAIGPDIGCFKSRALIEANFFGRTDPTINTFNLWEGFLELTSENLDFLAGQSYHPICIPTESPDTISYNSGIPMAPFALCPQFRLTYHNPCLEFLFAAIGFLGDRPFGLAGGTDKVFRDAMMPDFYGMAKFKLDDANYLGVGFDIYRLIPRLATNNNYKEDFGLTAISADLFIRFQSNDFVTYSKLVYAQDAAIFELIGGIAIHSIDPVTDLRTWVPLQTVAWYVEFIKQGYLEPGLFIGIVKNLGATKTVVPGSESLVSLFGIGINIDTVFRIAPRLRWYINSFILGVEYEYTRAAYGTPDDHARIINTIPVANNRFLFATYYVF